MSNFDRIFIRVGNPFDIKDKIQLEMEFENERDNGQEKSEPEDCSLGIVLFGRIEITFHGMREIEDFQSALNLIIERGKKRMKGVKNV